jgi:hypothetical protein
VPVGVSCGSISVKCDLLAAIGELNGKIASTLD